MDASAWPWFAWVVFAAAAVLEVGGDAGIRLGLTRGKGWMVAVGAVVLALYGVVVNQVPWNFSKLLGVYVCLFATASVLAGQLVFQEKIPLATWLGLALIIGGGLVIQFGSE